MIVQSHSKVIKYQRFGLDYLPKLEMRLDNQLPFSRIAFSADELTYFSVAVGIFSFLLH